MKIEDGLENIINSEDTIEIKTKKIKKLVKKLNQVETSISKINAMISDNNNINKD